MAAIARVDYVELNGPDNERMKAFYGAAFGWTFTDYSPEYSGFSDGREGEAGGLSILNPDATPLVILVTEDFDAARQSVIDAGGEIVSEHAFPGGKRFHFRDPGGNELAVWTKVED